MRAGDDAERSDAEERHKIPAGDDAERSDEERR
jgi:23S rRNA pseudouridine1911/1915/1917 synthase